MKKPSVVIKTTCFLMAFAILFTSCASTTLIRSIPEGAKVYVNGEPMGTTPCYYKDTKIVGSTNTLRLEKEGYEPLNTSFSRTEEVDVGAIVGGLFVWVPFLWTMKYKPNHTYELYPISDFGNKNQMPVSASKEFSFIEKLRDLKAALDEGLISQEEFEEMKTKILEEK